MASSEIVKRLPYLEAVINEGLRLHSTAGVGLPRVTPEGGLNVLGKFFPEGTVLSVPSYTIHRNLEIWGNDVEVFRPERWFERDQAGIQKTFNPFSHGPRSVQPGNCPQTRLTKSILGYDRACVARYLAEMELEICIATVFRRYAFVLEDPGKPVSNLTLTNHPSELSFSHSWTSSRELSADRFLVESA